MKKFYSMMRRAITSIWFKVVVAVCIIGLLVYFNRIDVNTLSSLSETWPWLLTAFSLMLPPFWIVSYRFKIILSSQGIEVSFRQAFRWTMIGSFFDLAMPSSNGGDFIKGGYVATHVGAGLRTRAVMAVAFDRIIGLLGLFLLAALVSVFGWSVLKDLPARELVVTISIAAGIIPLVIFRVAGARRIYNNTHFNRWCLAHKWGQRLRQMIGAFNGLRENPKTLFIALVLSIINHTFWCVSLLFIAMAVGYTVDPFKGFIVFPLAIFSGVFGVAGGFGLGTAAFDFLLSHLLLIQNGALIGLLFQTLGAITRMLGLPFYLAEKHNPKNIKTISLTG